jgi:undecaprenyl-diphosphatase
VCYNRKKGKGVRVLEAFFAWEWRFLDFLQESIRAPWLDVVMKVITTLGNGGILWIVTAVVLLFFRRLRPTGILMLLSLLSGAVVGNLFLKNVVARARPCWIKPEVNILIDVPTGYSFPSGHTLSSFAGGTALALGEKRAAPGALVLAALIAFSRLYLYVHFPSDVFVGMLLGVGLACLWHFTLNKRLASALSK